uniref:SMP-LTD domain-containing protein n=1 Tax=Oryza barthii TaxID=65489 RepID=A0A0D3GZC4_9ORYZ
MVLGKLWKVYRPSIENWIVGLLQPVIDNLHKPDYVNRVKIRQFNLGEEPLSIRKVERRTSRRANDLHEEEDGDDGLQDSPPIVPLHPQAERKQTRGLWTLEGVVVGAAYSFSKCIHLLSSNRFQGTCYRSCFIFGSIRNGNVLLMQHGYSFSAVPYRNYFHVSKRR